MQEPYKAFVDALLANASTGDMDYYPDRDAVSGQLRLADGDRNHLQCLVL